MKQIIYIMGVSGSGKTTTGLLLSTKTGIPFFDADDFHSEANKAKMKAGHALNDNDRQDWLITLNELAQKQQLTSGAIIACSALKEKYRNTLAADLAKPIWIFLQGSFSEIQNRLQNRSNHYMPPTLLQSQFDTLEIPEGVYTANINDSPDEIVAKILLYMQH
jgi:carbohydrate kinase (thermoresistant glucokinase family)